MKYKIQKSYTNNNNIVIQAGIYDETDIDLAEARSKSYVTSVDATTFAEQTIEQYSDKYMYFSATPIEDLKTFNPVVSMVTTVVKALKINSATVDEIAKIKYISRAVAETVANQRATKRFTSYNDLNIRAPLAFSRKWENVAVVDFEPKPKPENPLTIGDAVINVR